MLKAAVRSTLVLLFLFSLLTWVHPQLLLAWELSIVTTQLGAWFALLTLVAIASLVLLIKPAPPLRPFAKKDFAVLVLALFAFGTFITPIITTLSDHPGTVNLLQLFSLRAQETPYQRFSFIAANAKTPLNLDYYPAQGPGPHPWVLVIHGGGWINGDSLQLPEINWHLNRRGYAVISIDYRLAPGWLWPAPKDDALEALKFIRAHAAEWKISPDQWAILGRSAGAQIAGVVAYSLKGDARPKGFISLYGPADLAFGYQVGAEEDILRSRTLLRDFLGGTPDEKPEQYASASPVVAANENSCPTLLIHGREDILVYYKHTERLEAILKLKNVDYQTVWLRFGPHGFEFFFNGPEAQASTAYIDSFLAKVLPHAL